MQMRKLIGILTQRPRHNTTQILRRHNIRELARDEVGRIPGPEEIGLLVPVVLTTLLRVRLAVLFGAAPRVRDGDALARAVVGLAACHAEVVAGAAARIISEWKRDVGYGIGVKGGPYQLP